MSLRFSASILTVLVAAGGLSAQQAPAASLPDAHFLALGGVSLVRIDRATGDSPGLHLTAGVTGGAAVEGWGALGLAMLGRGGDYESTLLGAALSRRVLRGDNWSMLVFGGYALYGESGSTGTERDAGGILFGGSARWRVGAASIGAVFSHVTGNYDKNDVTAPFRFHVPRISLGLGF